MTSAWERAESIFVETTGGWVVEVEVGGGDGGKGGQRSDGGEHLEIELGEFECVVVAY